MDTCGVCNEDLPFGELTISPDDVVVCTACMLATPEETVEAA